MANELITNLPSNSNISGSALAFSGDPGTGTLSSVTFSQLQAYFTGSGGSTSASLVTVSSSLLNVSSSFVAFSSSGGTGVSYTNFNSYTSSLAPKLYNVVNFG